jgi:hypothetical protein
MKIDKGSLKEFKASAEKVRTELEEAIVDMYTHLYLFQQTTTAIMDQHGNVQDKNTHINIIRESMMILTNGLQRTPMHQSNDLALQTWRERLISIL